MMSFLAAYGTVRYNDRHLLVELEVGPLIITPTQISRRLQFFLFSSACWILMENCSLTLYIPEYGSEA